MKINDEEFEELISELDEFAYKGDKPCIIKFGNGHCGPCKGLIPVFEELEVEQDDFLVYSVDTDESPTTCNTLGIMSTPTILFVPVDGTPELAIGALNKEQILKLAIKYFI